MAGTIVADTIQADSTSTLVIKNGVANTPPTIQDSAGTQIGTFCRAWVNFNGTTNVGGFCTIRASFNVTSVADNGTGDYTINFTNALPDANYAAVCAARIEGAATIVNEANPSIPAKAAGSIRIATLNSTFSSTDAGQVNVAIFR
jgi:hypothetical protein